MEPHTGLGTARHTGPAEARTVLAAETAAGLQEGSKERQAQEHTSMRDETYRGLAIEGPLVQAKL